MISPVNGTQHLIKVRTGRVQTSRSQMPNCHRYYIQQSSTMHWVPKISSDSFTLDKAPIMKMFVMSERQSDHLACQTYYNGWFLLQSHKMY